MQGKGLIKFFAIIFAIVCLYCLSFTWFSHKVEEDARVFAKGDIEKENAYLDSVATLPIYGFSKDLTYQYAKAREIPLGLDLKGGMNVIMEVSLVDMVKNLANEPDDENFNQALHNASEDLKSSQKTFITLFGQEFEKLSPGARLAPFFATQDNAEYVSVNSSNKDVLKFLETQANVAIDKTYNILRTRIDKFGVASPNIQKEEGSNRILIELPGVKDPNRVRKLLQGSANLEFWETFSNPEVLPLLQNINSTLASTIKASDTLKTAAKADTGKAPESKLAALNLKKDPAKKDSSGQSLATQQQNPLFSKLSPNIVQDPNNQQTMGGGPVVGYAQIKDTAAVNAYFASDAVKSIIPGNMRFLWGVKPVQEGSNVLELYAIKVTKADGKAILEGDVVTDARNDLNPQNQQPEVTMYMNTVGANEWKRITAAASSDPNNKQAIAIVLDNSVYSAPTVQNEIPGGVSSITGRFTIADTKDLANVLKSGRLPAPARIVSDTVVGASLGEKAISHGLISSIVGLVVVLVFMIAYYNNAGTVANIAVFINIFFLLGILASLGAVLTLPGIAGIVLTMGMAVDANVLVYERVREEMGHGKPLRIAIADGYKHAMPSILDANITTFLTGVILYVFGTGPILGFATTLMIGILTSLFTAIFISRLVFEWMLGKDKKIKFSYPWSSHTFKNANFAFVKHRKIFYICSIIFISAGLISMFTRGFSLGVDFLGGRTYVVRYEKAVDIEQVRDNLAEVFGTTNEVKTYGPNNQVRITTPYLIQETSENADKTVEAKLIEGLNKIPGNKSEILSTQKVSATVANDVKTSAIYAVIFAILVIALYILFRFRKWQFSLGALIATAHDSLLVLSFFSLFNGILPFSLDIDQAFIAAILTVIGYSINDTVVVFDRIREYLNLHHAKTDDPAVVINDAVNSTLSRTVITALTVFFVLVVLFIFGGEVIRGFSFALLIGVVFGTYSSICVAAPVILDFGKKSLK
jgi:SecD/SecF fusion protein